MPDTVKKYRPSFTKQELSFLLMILQDHDYPDSEHKSISQKLKLLATKIDLGLTKPAFSAQPKQELTALLGIDPQEARVKAFEKKRAGEVLNPTEYSLYLDYVVSCSLATDEETKEWLSN